MGTLTRDLAAVQEVIDLWAQCREDELASAQPVAAAQPVAGESAQLNGPLTIRGGQCTLMACSDRACCNGCGVGFALRIPDGAREVPLEYPEDSGNDLHVGVMDCSLVQTRELLEATEVVVWGRYVQPAWEQQGALSLEVERVCRVPGEPAP